MNEQETPPPLDHGGSEAPEELLRALRALGREAPSRVTLERVAGRLGPLLDAAPPPPSLAPPGLMQAAQAAGSKLALLRAVAAVLALGGGAYWVQHALSARPSTPVVAAPSLSEAARAERSIAQPIVPAPAEGEARDERAEASSTQADHAPEQRASAHEERTRRARSTRGPRAARITSRSAATLDQARTDAIAAAASQTTRVEPPAAVQVEAPAVEAELAKPVAQARTPAAAPEDAGVVARPADEYTLLAQARAKLTRDPAGALNILQTHAGQYADGQLAPERDVMTIEALRKLGRSAEASERERAFRARYPTSIHLRRLQHKAD